MSVKISGAVWDADLAPELKYVLLALADHADHTGGSVKPRVSLVAWKTGLSARQVQRAMRGLERLAILIRTTDGKGGRGRVTEYRIAIDALPARAAFESLKGDSSSPFSPNKGRQLVTLSNSERVTSTTVKGDIHDSTYKPTPIKGSVIEPSVSGEPRARENPTRIAAAEGQYETTLNGSLAAFVPLLQRLDRRLTESWLRDALRAAEADVGPLGRRELGVGLTNAARSLDERMTAGKCRSATGLLRKLIVESLKEQRHGTS